MCKGLYYTIARVSIRVQCVSIFTVALVAANSVVTLLRAVVTIRITFIDIYLKNNYYKIFKNVNGKDLEDSGT